MKTGLLVGGVVAIVLIAVGAGAQPTSPRRVGVLSASTSSPGVLVEPWLAELGYRDGEEIRFERRPAAGRDDRLPGMAAELVRRKVDVIVAIGLPAIRAARKATAGIPIIMIAEGDPVKAGLVASLAHPGGNVTGVTVLVPALSAKRLELLREAVPGLRRAAILWNPDDGDKQAEWTETEAAARHLGIALQSLPLRARGDIEGAFDAAVKARSEGIVILADALVVGQARAIAGLARAKRLPAIYPTSYFVEPGQGGLIAYGPNLIDLSRRAAAYVDRILKGARPADLPVEQPARLDLTVNLGSARAIGLTLPPALLLRADRTIE